MMGSRLLRVDASIAIAAYTRVVQHQGDHSEVLMPDSVSDVFHCADNKDAAGEKIEETLLNHTQKKN